MSGPDGPAPERVVAGRYRLERVLGRGGMGVVWRAVDTLIERTVALKELRGPVGASADETDAFVERALREARHAGRLNHPAVVGIYDVIAPTGDDDAVYIVMEFVQAPTLADILDEQGPLPAPRVAAMGLGILDALDAAHAMGIVHRDIKPSNVLVADGDRAKLTDFGIALAAEDSRLTRSGVVGTHAYLAPESFDTGQSGPAADLWSLGATLFHAVAGRAPFDRDTTTATLRAILFEEPPAPPCEPALAQAITGLLTRPVERRLTSDAARLLLEPVAARPVAPTPTPSIHPGSAPWEAQATSLHNHPAPGPPPPPPPPTTQPGPPPSPYPTAPRPPAPAPRPRPSAPVASPAPSTQWASAQAQARPQRQRNSTPWIVGGVLTAAAAILAVALVASSAKDDGGGGGGDTGTPEAAAESFMEAAKRNDIATVENGLCQEDRGDDMAGTLSRSQVESYTIGAVEQQGDLTVVNAQIRIAGEDEANDGMLPMVQEGGGWKVCFSRMFDDGLAGGDESASGAGATEGSGNCPVIQTDPSVVANYFVSSLSVNEGDACLSDSVPASVVTPLLDRYFTPAGGTDPGPYTFEAFEDGDDTTLTVTVTQQSDGNYLVTDVAVS